MTSNGLPYFWRLLDVGVNEIHDALHQRMAEALFDRALAPFVLDNLGLAFLLHRFGELINRSVASGRQ